MTYQMDEGVKAEITELADRIEQCDATICYANQVSRSWEPTREIPTYRCNLHAGHEGVHMINGLCWSGTTVPLIA